MALRLDNVAITLHGKPLLRPFSLAIGPGEIVTLMGKKRLRQIVAAFFYRR